MLRHPAPPARRQSRRAPRAPDVRLPPAAPARDRGRARRLRRPDPRRDVPGEDGPGRVHRPSQDPPHLRAGPQGDARGSRGGHLLRGTDRPLEDRRRRGGVMLLYLARHAQTASSAVDSFNGRGELPLTDHGREQARKLGQRLAGVRFAALYRSPLGRTAETAALIVLSIPAEVLPGLTEIDYGRWEGLSPEQARALDPKLYEAWVADPASVAPPGGETAAQV